MQQGTGQTNNDSYQANPNQIKLDDIDDSDSDDEATLGGPSSHNTEAKEEGNCLKRWSNKLGHRGVFIAVAIGLVMISSYDTTKGIVTSFVDAPLPDQVWAAATEVYEFSEAESTVHVGCGDTARVACQAVFTAKVNVSAERVTVSNQENTEIIEKARNKLFNCNDNAYKMVQFLSLWQWKVREEGQRGQSQEVIKKRGSCTTKEQNILTKVLESSTDSDRAELILGRYTAEDKETDDSFISAIGDRYDYDKNYLSEKLGTGLQEDLSATLDEFTNNLPAPDIQAELDSINAEMDRLSKCTDLENDPCNIGDQYDQLTAQLEAKKLALNNTWQQVQGEIQSKKDDVYDKMDKVKDYWKAVEEFEAKLKLVDNLDAILSAGGADIGLADFPDPPPFCNGDSCLGTLDGWEVPEVGEIDLDGINPPDLSSITIDPSIVNGAKNTVTQVSTKASTEFQKTKDEIKTINLTVDDPFEDYNPPNNSALDGIKDTFAEKNRKRQEFLDSMLIIMNKFDSALVGPSTDENASTISDKFDEVAASLQIDISKIPMPTFEYFDARSIPVDLILGQLSSLSDMLSYSDTAYRIALAVWIFLKYWNMTAVGLPQVDVRRFRNTKKSGNSQMILKCLATPLVAITFALLLFSIIIYVGASLYMSMLNQYIDGCSTKGYGRNGTIITSNTYTIFYNMARIKGDRNLAQVIEAYETQRATICGEFGQTTADASNQHRKELEAVATTYIPTVEDMKLIKKCIDEDGTFFNPEYFNPSKVTESDKKDQARLWYLDIMANNLTTTPRDQIAIPEWPFSWGTEFWDFDGQCPEDLLDQEEFELKDELFNCTTIPGCDVSGCLGPDQPTIKYYAWTAGCMAEYSFHAGAVQTAMTVVVYICLNLSRVLLLAAISRWGWQYLTMDGGFTYIGNAEVTMKNSGSSGIGAKMCPGVAGAYVFKRLDDKDKLQEKGEEAIKKFQTSTIYYVPVIIIIQIIWIVPLIIANDVIPFEAGRP